MSDTLPNIPIPSNVWVDLYAASGFTVGEPMVVHNIGVCDIFLASQADAPLDDLNHQVLVRGDFLINDPGDAGAWAKCIAGGLVNVRRP